MESVECDSIMALHCETNAAIDHRPDYAYG